jgi:hypothetical protein
MTEVADVLDRYPELRREAEIVSLLNLLAISKQGLREILEWYRVGSPLEIKERISKGAIPGHPAYEDYLDAIAYSSDVRATGDALRRKLDEFLG